jgi:HEPN domain-containing protein
VEAFLGEGLRRRYARSPMPRVEEPELFQESEPDSHETRGAMADGFLDRSRNKLNDARTLCTGGIRHAEAVSAAQESIELGAKAVFLLLGPRHPKTHNFTEEQFSAVIEKLPENVKHHNFPRLYLLHRFWAEFYTTAKYGFESLGIPAQDLFRKAEADLAVHHANDWYTAATSLKAELKRREKMS